MSERYRFAAGLRLILNSNTQHNKSTTRTKILSPTCI